MKKSIFNNEDSGLRRRKRRRRRRGKKNYLDRFLALVESSIVFLLGMFWAAAVAVGAKLAFHLHTWEQPPGQP